MPRSEYDRPVARASTTSDVFNAIADMHRREVLGGVGSAAQRGPAFTPGEPGPFPGGLPPNPACAVKRTGLSSVYAACATGFAWIQSWHGAHTTSVLRRIFAMSTAHAGWPGPGVPSCLRPATW